MRVCLKSMQVRINGAFAESLSKHSVLSTISFIRNQKKSSVLCRTLDIRGCFRVAPVEEVEA